MDMNATTTFDTVDHRDETISFERAASARKTETTKTVVPATYGEGWYHDAAIAAAAWDAIDARSNPYRH